MAKAVCEEKKKVNRKCRMAILALALLLMSGLSLTVYSKYYKTRDNMGMAIASGFYFSSSYMAAVTPEDGDNIRTLSPTDLNNKYADQIVVSAKGWNGQSEYGVSIDIRNYDSQLLYNDRDLNVEYEVKFVLLDEPEGAAYEVQSVSGSQAGTRPLEWAGGQGKEVLFTGSLAGGSRDDDTYELKIRPAVSGAYTPSDILMVAYPVGPEYLKDAKCIAGILRFNYAEGEFKIQDSGFEVTKTEEYKNSIADSSNPDGWKEVVKKESGFNYQIITSGSYIGNNSAASKRTIQLKWKSSLFEINRNDAYYMKATDLQEPEGSFKVIEENGEKYSVLEIKVFPYALLEFTFFQGDSFINDITAMASHEEFERAITVTVTD